MLIIDLAVLAAHDAGQRNRLGLVGNQQHLAGQRAFLAVERCEFFAFGRAAHDDGRAMRHACCGQQMVIERVQRLADLQHHVIRDVHDVVDAADADFLQRVPQPIRARRRLSRLDDARGVARAKFGIFNAHGDQVWLAVSLDTALRESQRPASLSGLPVSALISRAIPMTLFRSGRFGVISRS